MLPSAVQPQHLLPTPAVNDMGEGKTVEEWDEWTDAMKARHGNGNGHGNSLAIEAQRLLPTPTVQDSANTGGQSQFDRNTLPLNAEVTLLPTPAASDGEGGKTSRSGDRKDEPLLGGIAKLLPSPSAADGNGGGRYSSEGHQKTLPGEARLMPTPRIAAGRTSRSAAVRRDSMSGPSIEQAVEIADGVLPREFKSWDELPPSWQPDQGQRLLPTTTAQDAVGARNSTAYRKNGGEGVNIGDTLTDVVWRSEGHHDDRMPEQRLEWGVYREAIERWETITYPAVPPTEPGPKGAPRLSPRFSEWMMGVPPGHITDTPGLTRNEMLKAAGNGVVPQQAAAALVTLLVMRARWAR